MVETPRGRGSLTFSELSSAENEVEGNNKAVLGDCDEGDDTALAELVMVEGNERGNNADEPDAADDGADADR